MHEILNPADVDASGLVELAQDPTAPEGLVFHHAVEGKPLATPWQVAVLRAALLAKHSLPEGLVLDCACGSGIQLAAYASSLHRPVLGVELEPARAHASAFNIQTVAAHHAATEEPWFTESRIVSGDGTDAEGVLRAVDTAQRIAFLHLDPARPRNSRTHALEEMQPPLHSVLREWAPHFAGEPAFVLDLSPRLTDQQRGEVEALVEALWPGLPRTWEWTSRGRGRVDRLALWGGCVAERGTSRRFVRVPQTLGKEALILRTGDTHEAPTVRVHPPKRGEFVSLLDAALVESGLVSSWLPSVSKDHTFRWAVVEGRRPQVHHEHALRLNQQQGTLVQATGRVIELLNIELNESTVDGLVEYALEHNFRSVKLRLDLDPTLQPVLQGSLDRQLQRRHGVREGFLTRHPNGHTLLLCVLAHDEVEGGSP
jgi:hypothetical protein